MGRKSTNLWSDAQRPTYCEMSAKWRSWLLILKWAVLGSLESTSEIQTWKTHISTLVKQTNKQENKYRNDFISYNNLKKPNVCVKMLTSVRHERRWTGSAYMQGLPQEQSSPHLMCFVGLFGCCLYDFGECILTPEGHEDGEEDSGWVVKQVAGPSCTTCCHQFPVAAGSVTKGTHGDVVPGITNLHTGKTHMIRGDNLFQGMWEGNINLSYCINFNQ